MPVTLTQIASNTASVTFAVGQDSVTVVYYPGRVTEKALADLQDLGQMTGDTVTAGFSAFNETLAGLIKSWDVMNDDGTMFPVEAARLAELPIGFRIQVISAILGDLRPEAMAPHLLNGNS